MSTGWADHYGTYNEQVRSMVSFKQYSKGKPVKYGILVKFLNSSRYPYVHRAEPYVSKPVEDGTHYIYSVEEVTFKLIYSFRMFHDMSSKESHCRKSLYQCFIETFGK